MPNLEELRQQTYKESIRIAKQYHKCAIIRPTSFGKTQILAKFITSGEFKHILFLYPTDAVKNAALNFCIKFGTPEDLSRVTFYSYTKLQKLTDGQWQNLEKTDLVLADECHKLGGRKTREAYQYLQETIPETAWEIGATATPVRMDKIDIIKTIYENHVVSPYTCHNMFQDGNAHKPIYVYSTYRKMKGVKKEIDKNTKDAMSLIQKADAKDRTMLEQEFNARTIQISKLIGVSDGIRKTCEKHVKDTSCMNFIIFFANFNHLHEKSGDVRNWFHDAYPNHAIQEINVTTEKPQYAKNLEKIARLPHEDNTIRLIYTCDMLNLGHHSNDTTGLVFYRPTWSNTIYTQQYGRSMGTGKSAIIFDIVDNLHRTPIYSTIGKPHQNENRIRLRQLNRKAEHTGLTKEEEKERDLLESLLSERWWDHVNELEPEDLIINNHVAKYQELVKKLVEEPRRINCKRAWETWIACGGDASVKTQEAILQNDTIKSRRVKQVPLRPFCMAKGVTVEEVFEEMGIH